MHEQVVKDIKTLAFIKGVTVHDLIMLEVLTPENRGLVYKYEWLMHDNKKKLREENEQKQNKQDWKKDFDREFVQDNNTYIEPSFKDPAGDVQRVRNFIEEQLTKAREEGARGLAKHLTFEKTNSFALNETNEYIGAGLIEYLKSLKKQNDEKQKTKNN